MSLNLKFIPMIFLGCILNGRGPWRACSRNLAKLTKKKTKMTKIFLRTLLVIKKTFTVRAKKQGLINPRFRAAMFFIAAGKFFFSLVPKLVLLRLRYHGVNFLIESSSLLISTSLCFSRDQVSVEACSMALSFREVLVTSFSILTSTGLR